MERSPHSPIGPALGILTLGLLIAGCGTSEREIASAVRCDPPVERSSVVETVVSLPFDEAWGGLIRRLSESAFQMSALEKASRFVRVDLARSSDLATTADEPVAPARSFGPRVESIRFTTFQPGSDRWQGGLSCRATGEFEHALVALANPAAAI